MSERDEELRRQLGTLWRTAIVGFDTVREVVVRSTQAGRLRVDIALLQRERAQLLQTLGEMVVGLIDEGAPRTTIAGDDVPEALRQVYERVKDVESRIKSDHARALDNAFGAPRGYEPEAASDYGDDEPALPGDFTGFDEHDAAHGHAVDEHLAVSARSTNGAHRTATSAPRRTRASSTSTSAAKAPKSGGKAKKSKAKDR